MNPSIRILIGAAIGTVIGLTITAIRRARSKGRPSRPGWAPVAIGAIVGGVLAAFVAPSGSRASLEHVPAVRTPEEFREQVLQARRPVLVDFYATWCGPCRLLEPTIAELAREYENRVTVVRVDVDQAQEIARRYEIRAIPTILVFRAGDVASRLRGVREIGEYREALDQALAGDPSGPTPSAAAGLTPTGLAARLDTGR